MTRIVARAPGKLFVLGEYAVLDGAPAIVAAVDRYVKVELEPDEGTPVSLTSDQDVATLTFDAGHPPADDPFYHVALAAYRTCLQRYPTLRRCGLRVRIVSAASYAEHAKIGFGSSAAVAAALVAALAAAAKQSAELDVSEIFELAFTAHRQAQGGFGSGADVAASVFGSLLLFQPHAAKLPDITPLPLPQDFGLLVGWTGTSASSVDLIRRYQALTNGNAAARAAFVATSIRAVREFAAAAERGQLALAAVDASTLAIEALVGETQLPILTAQLRQLIRVARAHGASAKISGAGGGDCGIALVRDAVHLDAIEAAWRAAGLTPLDVGISRRGVSVELV